VLIDESIELRQILINGKRIIRAASMDDIAKLDAAFLAHLRLTSRPAPRDLPP